MPGRLLEQTDGRDAGSTGGDATEAEHGGDQGDDEENDGVVQHGDLLVSESLSGTLGTRSTTAVIAAGMNEL